MIESTHKPEHQSRIKRESVNNNSNLSSQKRRRRRKKAESDRNRDLYFNLDNHNFNSHISNNNNNNYKNYNNNNNNNYNSYNDIRETMSKNNYNTDTDNNNDNHIITSNSDDDIEWRRKQVAWDGLSSPDTEFGNFTQQQRISTNNNSNNHYRHKHKSHPNITLWIFRVRDANQVDLAGVKHGGEEMKVGFFFGFFITLIYFMEP